jgi:hypothetical protein
VIQSIYKLVEIELEMHQQADDYWKCDYMLITHPEREVTRVKGVVKFPALWMAKEYALEEARAAIDNGAYRGSGVRGTAYEDDLALR